MFSNVDSPGASVAPEALELSKCAQLTWSRPSSVKRASCSAAGDVRDPEDADELLRLGHEAEVQVQPVRPDLGDRRRRAVLNRRSRLDEERRPRRECPGVVVRNRVPGEIGDAAGPALGRRVVDPPVRERRVRRQRRGPGLRVVGHGRGDSVAVVVAELEAGREARGIHRLAERDRERRVGRDVARAGRRERRTGCRDGRVGLRARLRAVEALRNSRARADGTHEVRVSGSVARGRVRKGRRCERRAVELREVAAARAVEVVADEVLRRRGRGPREIDASCARCSRRQPGHGGRRRLDGDREAADGPFQSRDSDLEAP